MRTRAQDDADYGDGAYLSLRTSVHLSPHTTVEVTTYPEEHRVTIGLGGYRGTTGVTLFVDMQELQELRDLLSGTLTALTNNEQAA
jgi:hypothetical protein